MTGIRERRWPRVARYAALAAAVYLAASLVALTVPALLGGGQGLTVAGGAVILLTLGLLPVALVVRAGIGVAPSTLVTAAMVLIAQVALAGLGALGVPGLLPAEATPDPGVQGALMNAVTFALIALVPAATAAVCTSAGIRVWRAWRARRDGPAAAGSAP
jgi:hypothetical protein